MMWRSLVVATALAGLMLLSACDDGGDDEPTPTETPETTATTVAEATGTEEPDATPAAGRTGIPELDAIIDALIADHGQKETPALSALIGFTEMRCTATPVVDVGEGPLCQLNEDHGELVEVFRLGVCEGQLLRPGQIDQALSLLAGMALYAIYRPPAGDRYSGDYVAVVTDTAAERTGLAWAIEIDDGKIVRLSFSCAAGPEEFVQQFAPEDVVLPPASQ